MTIFFICLDKQAIFAPTVVITLEREIYTWLALCRIKPIQSEFKVCVLLKSASNDNRLTFMHTVNRILASSLSINCTNLKIFKRNNEYGIKIRIT